MTDEPTNYLGIAETENEPEPDILVEAFDRNAQRWRAIGFQEGYLAAKQEEQEKVLELLSR